MSPTVFISYSWDSHEEWGEQNEQWVAELAGRLADDNISVSIDKWKVHPGDSIPHFMEKAIAENDKILIICTPRYKYSSDNRKGAVGYESHIISSLILQSGDHRKFITVIKQGDEKTAVPTGLIGKYHIRLNDVTIYEVQYTLLLDAIHDRCNISSATVASLSAGNAATSKVPDSLNLSFAVLQTMNKADIKAYINHYKKQVQANSFNPAAWFGLGLCTLHYESYEAATLHLERAVHLDVTNADYHYYLALSLCGGKNPGELDGLTEQKVLDSINRAISLNDCQAKYYGLLLLLMHKKNVTSEQLIRTSRYALYVSKLKESFIEKNEIRRLLTLLKIQNSEVLNVLINLTK